MIVDTFILNDELSTLKLRLDILKDVVDLFIVAESPTTFTGLTKPLYFQENKEAFRDFNIRGIVAPVFEYHRVGNIWGNEFSLRNFLCMALDEFSNDTVVLYSDVDEIPNPKVFGQIRSITQPAVLEQLYFFYGVNYQSYEGVLKWTGTTVTRKEHIRREPVTYDNLKSKGWGFQEFRELRGRLPIILNGGWHYSYLGGVDVIRRKLQSFCHAEDLNKPPFNTEAHLLDCIREGKSVWVESDGNKFRRVELTKDNCPEHILQNIDKYQDLLV